MHDDMTRPSTPDTTQRKVKRLSAAVWILAIVLCLTLLASFVFVHSLSVARSEFDRLSPEERVRVASVIALTKWQRSGSTFKCMISEILKQAPDTKFYYKVGDEIRSHSQTVRETPTTVTARYCSSPARRRAYRKPLPIATSALLRWAICPSAHCGTPSAHRNEV